MQAKVLSDDRADHVALWQAPSMDAEASGLPAAGMDGEDVRSEDLRPMTAEQLEAVQETARQEGFALGHDEGLAAGQEEIRRRAQEWSALIDGLCRPLAEVDERVIEELAALAAAIARQVVTRELQHAPDEIVQVVREALAALPSQAAAVRVKLHPDDAALVRELMGAGDEDRAWSVVEDPALGRGGCVVQSDVSRVDATVETRLNRAIATVMGDRRGGGAG